MSLFSAVAGLLGRLFGNPAVGQVHVAGADVVSAQVAEQKVALLLLIAAHF
jgi:hypothetical protein